MTPQLAPRITGSWVITFDGACWPNPGGAMGVGYKIDSDGEYITKHHGFPAAPRNSNNLAEWYALGFSLLAAAKLIETRVKPELLVIRGDSMLVINQLSGKWKAKNPAMKSCLDRCLKLIAQIDPAKWEAEWIARELNETCDGLSKAGYREQTGRDIPEMQQRRGA